MTLRDELVAAFAALDDAERDRVAAAAMHGLFYYADPDHYYACSLIKIPSAETGGDIRHDYGDEVSGNGGSIKPGQVARETLNTLFESGGSERLDWNQQQFETDPDLLAEMGIDIVARRDMLVAEAEARELEEYEAKEAARASDPNFERYECCGSTSEYAVGSKLVMVLDPEGRDDFDGNPRYNMPSGCPRCESPIPGGGPSRQPYTQDYLCGGNARSCGHVSYFSKSSRALCDHIAQTKGIVND